jgi:hypothetical protein
MKTTVTVWEAWLIDDERLPSGVVSCTERKLIDVLHFDGDQVDFTEALADEGMTYLASRDWQRGRSAHGRTEYTAQRDSALSYVAEVVETMEGTGPGIKQAPRPAPPAVRRLRAS